MIYTVEWSSNEDGRSKYVVASVIIGWKSSLGIGVDPNFTLVISNFIRCSCNSHL